MSGSTVLLVTRAFIQALSEGTGSKHARWPHSSSEKDRIKHKFDKIHGLPNCCGVLHTTQFKFRSKRHDHEENVGALLQIIVDTDMRFTDIWLGLSDGNQCSVLQDSRLIMECEEGGALNGSRLKVASSGASDSDVREYVIGDAGYPLFPWLLTPYQLEDDLTDSDMKNEFNRRHSTATTTVVLRALARLKDTWRCLQGEVWHPSNEEDMFETIAACCVLHNIVIDMEEEGADMQSDQEQDAERVRDALAQHLMESGVHTMAASGSGDKNSEQAGA